MKNVMKNTRPGDLLDTMRRFGHLVASKRHYACTYRQLDLEAIGVETQIVIEGNIFKLVLV